MKTTGKFRACCFCDCVNILMKHPSLKLQIPTLQNNARLNNSTGGGKQSETFEQLHCSAFGYKTLPHQFPSLPLMASSRIMG